MSSAVRSEGSIDWNKAKAAAPFVVGSLAVSTAGAVIILVSATTAMQITGIVVAALAGYAFFGALICWGSSKNAHDFKEQIGPCLAIGAMAGLRILIEAVIHAALHSLFRRAFY